MNTQSSNIDRSKGTTEQARLAAEQPSRAQDRVLQSPPLRTAGKFEDLRDRIYWETRSIVSLMYAAKELLIEPNDSDITRGDYIDRMAALFRLAHQCADECCAITSDDERFDSLWDDLAGIRAIAQAGEMTLMDGNDEPLYLLADRAGTLARVAGELAMQVNDWAREAKERGRAA